MGGELVKPLIEIGGRSCLDRALAILGGRCHPLLIGGPDDGTLACPAAVVVPDLRRERLGPLAALEAAHAHLAGTAITHLVTVPGDTPFLPNDLVARLSAADPRTASIARFRGRLHPTVALWPLADLAGLGARLDRQDTNRSLMGFLETIGFEAVDFPQADDAPDGDPFFNLNTPQDLETARSFAR